MIPAFPNFISLTPTIKRDLLSYTEKFPPYSDYDYVSLVSWNIHEKTQLSQLHGNLIIKFSDYLSNEEFFSFLGNTAVNDTISTLLRHAKKMNISPNIKLIPHHNWGNSDTQTAQWNIEEDRDNFDYILDTQIIATMQGKKLHGKRRKLNYFQKTYRSKVKIETKTTPALKKELKSFYDIWESSKPNSEKDHTNEKIAFERFLHHSHTFHVNYVLVYTENSLIGFSVFEQINKEYAISAFQKANPIYKGIYEKLNHEMAKWLHLKRCIFMNIEQDLGKAGLRRAKLDYNPVFLKKYILNGAIKSP